MDLKSEKMIGVSTLGMRTKEVCVQNVVSTLFLKKSFHIINNSLLDNIPTTLRKDTIITIGSSGAIGTKAENSFSSLLLLRNITQFSIIFVSDDMGNTIQDIMVHGRFLRLKR